MRPPRTHRYLGQIQESLSGKCLDAIGRETPPGLRTCHGLGGYQTLMYSMALEIRTATRCLSPEVSSRSTLLTNCELSCLGVQKWGIEMRTVNIKC